MVGFRFRRGPGLKQSSFFDAVRGAAALVVLAAHVWQIFGATYVPDVTVMAVAAEYAVYAFFLLSGYLITKSLLLNVDRNHGKVDAFDYAASRFARIYPPLIFSIIAVFVALGIIRTFNLPGAVTYGAGYQARDAFTASPSEIFPSLTMRGGFGIADGPLWSLYIEVKLYAIALGLALLIAPKSSIIARLAGTLIAVAIATNAYRNNGHFVFYSAIWSAGAALAFTKLHPLNWAPRPLVAAGGYSYTLYVIHFPLLLLALSLTQTMIAGRLSLAILTGTLSGFAVILIADRTARLVENHKAVKAQLLCFVFEAHRLIQIWRGPLAANDPE